MHNRSPQPDTCAPRSWPGRSPRRSQLDLRAVALRLRVRRIRSRGSSSPCRRQPCSAAPRVSSASTSHDHATSARNGSTPISVSSGACAKQMTRNGPPQASGSLGSYSSTNRPVPSSESSAVAGGRDVRGEGDRVRRERARRGDLGDARVRAGWRRAHRCERLRRTPGEPRIQLRFRAQAKTRSSSGSFWTEARRDRAGQADRGQVMARADGHRRSAARVIGSISIGVGGAVVVRCGGRGGAVGRVRPQGHHAADEPRAMTPASSDRPRPRSPSSARSTR